MEESERRREWDGARDSAREGWQGAAERYEKGKRAKRLQADVSGLSLLYIFVLTLIISHAKSCGCYQIMSAIRLFSWPYKVKPLATRRTTCDICLLQERPKQDSLTQPQEQKTKTDRSHALLLNYCSSNWHSKGSKGTRLPCSYSSTGQLTWKQLDNILWGEKNNKEKRGQRILTGY